MSSGYVVLQGTLTLITETQGQRQETQLHPLDSVAIAPHESRQLFNPSPHEAQVLLVMPMPITPGEASLNSTFRLVEMIMGHRICSDPQPLIHWRAG